MLTRTLIPSVQLKWISKDWFTYYGSGDDNSKNNQLFYVDPYKAFTYLELTTNMTESLAYIQQVSKKSDSAIAQLQSFMNIFIQTVDQHPELRMRINGCFDGREVTNG